MFLAAMEKALEEEEEYISGLSYLWAVAKGRYREIERNEEGKWASGDEMMKRKKRRGGGRVRIVERGRGVRQ